MHKSEFGKSETWDLVHPVLLDVRNSGPLAVFGLSANWNTIASISAGSCQRFKPRGRKKVAYNKKNKLTTVGIPVHPRRDQ